MLNNRNNSSILNFVKFRNPGLTFIGHMFSGPWPPRFFGPKAAFNSERSLLKVFQLLHIALMRSIK